MIGREIQTDSEGVAGNGEKCQATEKCSKAAKGCSKAAKGSSKAAKGCTKAAKGCSKHGIAAHL